MTFAEFKAWKIGMAKRDLARARRSRLAGRPGIAAWHLTGAAFARQSILNSKEG